MPATSRCGPWPGRCRASLPPSEAGRRIISDVDGSYPDNTGPTTIVRKSRRPHLNFDGWWGSHWSLNILWPLAWPEVMGNFAAAMTDIYRYGGVMPRCAAGGNHSDVMTGDTAAPFLAAARQKGVRGWDAETAYEGRRKNHFPGGIATKGFIEGNSAVWTFYVPHDLRGLASLFGGPGNATARLVEDYAKAIPFNFIGKHYDLTAPRFDKVTIRLHLEQRRGDATGNRSFTIVTRNNRPENVHIQSVRLNGEPWSSSRLHHARFIRGGTLELDLGPEPNQQWGVR